MSDLFGNHIVGFPTRRLTCCHEMGTVNTDMTLSIKFGLVQKNPIEAF